jgi:hypothetical protein
MQAGGLLLHKLSLYKALCRLPNHSELHPISLDRSYAAYQTPPTFLLNTSQSKLHTHVQRHYLAVSTMVIRPHLYLLGALQVAPTP